MKKRNSDHQNGRISAEVNAKAKEAAQATILTVQENMQSGLEKAQDALIVGRAVAQEMLKRRQMGAKRADKEMKRAQKTMRHLQSRVQPRLAQAQNTLQSKLDQTQSIVDKKMKDASRGMRKTQENIKEVGESVQSRMEQHACRRKRARAIFRLGLLLGVVLILLYAPQAGSETRRQLTGRIRQGFQLFRQMRGYA